MAVYLCRVCNLYVYDEKKGNSKLGLNPGTSFDSLPDSFRCPVCNAKKEFFRKLSRDEEDAAVEKYKSYKASIQSSDGKKLTLAEVRDRARERMRGVCAVNRVCDAEPDRLCMGQTYGGPIGLGGVGKGLSFTENVQALGADAALIGRDIIRSAIGGDAEGVALHFEYLKSEIRRGMILTSCKSIDQIDESIIDGKYIYGEYLG